MYITQISVFLENKKGRIKEITQTLSDANLNIRALSIAETKDFGVVRMILNQPEEAYKVLKNQGLVVRKTDVLAIEVEDQPGGLNGVLSVLEDNNINVEYLYSFVEKATEKALMVMRFENIAQALKFYKQKYFFSCPRQFTPFKNPVNFCFAIKALPFLKVEERVIKAPSLSISNPLQWGKSVLLAFKSCHIA